VEELMDEEKRKIILKQFDKVTKDERIGSEEARALYSLLNGLEPWPDYDNAYEFTKSFRQGEWSKCAGVDYAIWNLLNSKAAYYFWLNFENAQEGT
jgi:hypothetical protein